MQNTGESLVGTEICYALLIFMSAALCLLCFACLNIPSIARILYLAFLLVGNVFLAYLTGFNSICVDSRRGGVPRTVVRIVGCIQKLAKKKAGNFSSPK